MKKRSMMALLAIAIMTAFVITGCNKGDITPPGQNNGQEQQNPGKQPSDKGNSENPKTAKKPGLYFPLPMGAIWEYEGEGNEYATFTREVIFTGGNRAQIREDNGGTVMALVFETTDNAVTRIFRQGEVYENINLLNKAPTEKTVLLKAPLQKGTQWKDDSGDREIVEVNATVDTPAGKFEQCIKVKIAGQDSTMYEYYKEGVGMVKREFISGDTKVTSTLKRFVSGKA